MTTIRFWLRFAAWAAGMAGVRLAYSIVTHSVGDTSALPLLQAVAVSARIGIGGALAFILAFAAFPAGFDLGARGAGWRRVLPAALLVALVTLLASGLLLPMLDWWLGRHVSPFHPWDPIRALLPSAVWETGFPHSGQEVAVWRAGDRLLEAVALLAGVLAITGALLGRSAKAIPDATRRSLLPWLVALPLLAFVQLSLSIAASVSSVLLPFIRVDAAADAVAILSVSPATAAYSILLVPVAVAGTLILLGVMAGPTKGVTKP